jgi:hypothetical protein
MTVHVTIVMPIINATTKLSTSKHAVAKYIHEQVEKTHNNELSHRRHSQDHIKRFEQTHLIQNVLRLRKIFITNIEGTGERGGGG